MNQNQLLAQPTLLLSMSSEALTNLYNNFALIPDTAPPVDLQYRSLAHEAKIILDDRRMRTEVAKKEDAINKRHKQMFWSGIISLIVAAILTVSNCVSAWYAAHPVPLKQTSSAPSDSTK